FYLIWSLAAGSLAYNEDVTQLRSQPVAPGYYGPIRVIPASWQSEVPLPSHPIRRRDGPFLSGPPRPQSVPQQHHMHVVRFYERPPTPITQPTSDPLTTITETLGALNTVGSFIVNMTRGGVDSAAEPPKELPSALYTISKNILGRNVTDSIAPLVRGVTLPLRPSISQSQSGSQVAPQQPLALPNSTSSSSSTTNSSPNSEDRVDDLSSSASSDTKTLLDLGNRDHNRPGTDSPSCTTSENGLGRCQDLSNCPQLLLDLTKLRQSICFKSLFVPGVCCPINDIPLDSPPPPPPTSHTVAATSPSALRPTMKPTPRPIPLFTTGSTTTTTAKTSTTSSTTRRPPVVESNVDVFSHNATNVLESIDNNFIQDDDECGVRETGKYRVVGGEEALPGRWPWMAAIFLHGSRKTEFWCGGSLIGSRHILTAAHCTRDQRQKPFLARQFTVRLGDIDLENDDEPSSPETYAVKEIHAHSKFSRAGFYNDIAILELDRPVRRSPYVIPICLPQMRHKGELDGFAGARPTVVGWGTTYYGGKESTIQRQAVLPVWRNEACNQAYYQPITSNFLCAGYSQGGKDACQGDSGGPLMLRTENRWMQIGIVSFGNKCGEPGYPGVYTRVSEYLDWIKSSIR
ncbi:hypothetical protein QAD02_000239, partial [Eretmocerus hayati]